ncbi:MAG: hypothetical protein IJ198_14515 [Lachnospiraceae bacterium]|nr:hypothetical protein [Lachnospiraceae bacterium]
MADVLNIRNQMHLMLRKYVEQMNEDEGTAVGGEIPYPVFIVFVGDRICKEAREYILPEMKRHWPTCFAGASVGRLLYLLIDRDPDTQIRDDCGVHGCLTSEKPLKSLTESMEDCKAVNNAIRKVCEKASSVAGANNMRLIAVTSIEDPDSLLTGEVLALVRQFGKAILMQRSNEGELFACLPDRVSLSEEGVRQGYDFWVNWKKWNDVNGRFPNIFMRFGSRALPADGGVPAVRNTFIFDCIDNNGANDIDHWRDRLMADVLEIPRPADLNPMHIPGVIEDELNYEYVLLKAMTPSNWEMPSERKVLPWNSADDIRSLMEKEIAGPRGDDVEASIQKWLQRACVAKVRNHVGGEVQSVDKIEDLYFGASIKRMFGEFKKQFLGRKISAGLLEKFTQVKGDKQIEKTLDFLQELIGQTKKKVPDRGDYPGPTSLLSYSSIWAFKEDVIDPSYIRRASNCTEALIHEWAIECREALLERRAGDGASTDTMSTFAEIHNHEVIAQSNYWGAILYDGPKMSPLSKADSAAYKKAVSEVMRDPSERNLFKLFDLVDKRIEDEDYPSFRRIRATCQTTDLFPLAADGGTVRIADGVSKGERVTFTIVPKLDFIRFAFECNQYFGEEE